MVTVPLVPSFGSAYTSRGFTYLGLLMMVAGMGVTLAGVAEVSYTISQREKEQQLLYVGAQYRRAIHLYHASTSGSAHSFPRELADLLGVADGKPMRRYLRRLYADPMTNTTDWGLIKSDDGGIAGVYSTSDRAPYKTGNFAELDSAFEGKAKYSDWKFEYRPFAPAAATLRP
jgi:type II secretory pathway pseudopilin PulG